MLLLSRQLAKQSFTCCLLSMLYIERRQLVDQYKAHLGTLCIPPESLRLVKVIGEGMKIVAPFSYSLL